MIENAKNYLQRQSFPYDFEVGKTESQRHKPICSSALFKHVHKPEELRILWYFQESMQLPKIFAKGQAQDSSMYTHFMA